jgi:peroxiredoxin
MSKQQKQTRFLLVVVIAALILAAVVIWRVAIYKSAPQTQTHHQQYHSYEHSFESGRLIAALNKIIRNARTWGPIYTSWYGKTAPDFTLTDISGKQHKLSDYRGKNVMIIFWATWCRPCLIEMPHLIALRNIITEDKLAMLAISNENPVLVRNFATDRKINYPVLSNTGTMPAPYNQIRGIPCSFFIEPNGKIKLATEGTLSLGEMRAILQADSQTQ